MNTNKPENVATALGREIDRNRKLLEIYRQIPTGVFGAATIDQDIQEAVNALSSGDAVRIIRAYEAMKNNK